MRIVALLAGMVMLGYGIASYLINRTPAESESQISVPVDCDAIQDGSDFMRCELAKIESKTDYLQQRYASDKHSAALAAEFSSNPSNLKLQLAYIEARLNAGNNLEAIHLLEQIDTEKLTKKSQHYKLKSLLAIAYMRLGEQDNCLGKENPNVCIIPLLDENVYSIREGPLKAREIYMQMLQKNKDDLNSRWLLNLANIAIGEYPDAVRPDLRVRGAFFENSEKFPRFQNIASMANVAEIGLAGGSIFEDFNSDGWLDIMVSSWDIRDQLKLYINNGDSTFSDSTSQANLDGITGGLNLNQTDFNNDGCIDVLVLRGAWLRKQGKQPNSLLQNDCHGGFNDVTRDSGILSYNPTQTATWLDFNIDGWIDLFIGNEKKDAELFRNNGDGTFTDVTDASGIKIRDFVKGVTSGDMNNDGLPDIYVSVFNGRNRLFKNLGENHDGQIKFEDITIKSGIDGPDIGFPAFFWDFNNDGWLDILSAGYIFGAPDSLYVDIFPGISTDDKHRTYLYRNNGDETFNDVSETHNIDLSLSAMGINFGDLDNDGFQDLYIGTGSPDLRSVIPNRMFLNQYGRDFIDVTTPGGFGHIQKGHGISFGDFDNDGDQDLYAVMGGAFSGDIFQNALYENPGNDNNWVTFILEGSESNRAAIGTRLKLTVDDGTTTREIYGVVNSGGSFGANPLRAEIGVGHADRIRKLEIRWPTKVDSGNSIQVFNDIPTNSFYRIVQGSDAVIPVTPHSS